jgi:hypothetical protein
MKMNSNIKDIYTIMTSYRWNKTILEDLKNDDGIIKYDKISNRIGCCMDRILFNKVRLSFYGNLILACDGYASEDDENE